MAKFDKEGAIVKLKELGVELTGEESVADLKALLEEHDSEEEESDEEEGDESEDSEEGEEGGKYHAAGSNGGSGGGGGGTTSNSLWPICNNSRKWRYRRRQF